MIEIPKITDIPIPNPIALVTLALKNNKNNKNNKKEAENLNSFINAEESESDETPKAQKNKVIYKNEINLKVHGDVSAGFQEGISKFLWITIAYFIFLFLLWVLWIYVLIKTFSCKYDKAFHILGAFFLFPLYHVYYFVAGCGKKIFK